MFLLLAVEVTNVYKYESNLVHCNVEAARFDEKPQGWELRPFAKDLERFEKVRV
jgi:hypothetical protein